MSQREAGGDYVGCLEKRDLVLAQIPDGGNESEDQAAGEDSAGLQGVEAEDVADAVVGASPLIDDVERLGTNNSGKDHEAAEIPHLVRIEVLLLRQPQYDHQPEQHAQGD